MLLLKIQIYNEDRYEHISVLGTGYVILVHATLGAQQVHNMSMHLNFPALLLINYNVTTYFSVNFFLLLQGLGVLLRDAF